MQMAIYYEPNLLLSKLLVLSLLAQNMTTLTDSGCVVQ